MTGCKIASPKYFMTKEHKSQHDSLLNSSHSQYKLLLFWLPVCLGISYSIAQHYFRHVTPKNIWGLVHFTASAPGCQELQLCHCINQFAETMQCSTSVAERMYHSHQEN